ncbi:MAG: TIR domain-containing protein [Verrucomicrobia bacterium]|nr:TIR domain-containing protein [Verrucomicrobiota bacterium]
MSEPGKAVFLSYASQDAEAARRIAEALRAAGVEVWFDQSELRGGDAWDQKIRRQIRECALFVPVISRHTQERLEGYFRLEWRLADQRTHLMATGKAFVVPVVVDATGDAGAYVPDSFTAVQWTRIGDDPGAWTAFADRVRRLLHGESAAAARDSAAPLAPRPPAAADQRSVAVLAFANRSSDRENEFFSDGISEELLNALVKVPGLKVTARTSSFYFKGKDVPLADIARHLGVAYVVDGSVRRAGDRVRITAQLVKAADGFQAWSETFDRELKDIFAVQDEIAGLIAKNLSLKLGGGGVTREVNPEAYRLFLEGRSIFHREIPALYDQAIRCFQQSLELDPDASQTWALLAMNYCLAGGTATLPIGVAHRLAREAATRAVALDPHQVKAHLAMAFQQLMFEWDWKPIQANLARAATIAPGDAEVIGMQAHLLAIVGRLDEAIALARKAVELDPLGYLSNYALARSLRDAERFDEMLAQCERMIALNPDALRCRLFHSLALLLLNRPDEAASAAERVPLGWARRMALACARFAQGRRADSDAAVADLIREDGAHAAYQVAEVYAYRGDLDLAFEWLETSHRQRDTGTALVRQDPLMRRLRADPRWSAFLRKMNLDGDPLA